MFIPSARLFKKLLNENGGVFFEEISDGTVPFVLKLPSTVVKEIYKQCPIKLIISIDIMNEKNYLTVGFQVEDDPEYPISFFSTYNNVNEYEAFLKAITKMNNKLHLFDELSRNVVSGELFLDDSRKEVLQYLAQSKITTELSEEEKQIMEEDFRKNFELAHKGGTVKAAVWSEISLEFNPSLPLKIIDADFGLTTIDQKEEGIWQEQIIYQLIESYHPKGKYHSPKFYKKNKEKELTDILCLNKDYLLMIESKALQLFDREKELTSERKIKNINSHINQAIGQLGGAIRTIRSEQPIYDVNKERIEILTESKSHIHCVILLSEMYSFLDWEELYIESIKFTNKNHALLHIMDISELFRALFISSTPEVFKVNLLLRWEMMYNYKTAFIRGEYK